MILCCRFRQGYDGKHHGHHLNGAFRISFNLKFNLINVYCTRRLLTSLVFFSNWNYSSYWKECCFAAKMWRKCLTSLWFSPFCQILGKSGKLEFVQTSQSDWRGCGSNGHNTLSGVWLWMPFRPFLEKSGHEWQSQICQTFSESGCNLTKLCPEKHNVTVEGKLWCRLYEAF